MLNPLERYFNRDDVEVLDNGKKGGEGDSMSVPAFDIDLDGPRLPQDGGLRTRMLGDGVYNNNNNHKDKDSERYFDRRAFCAGNGHNMKWSDWVSCLHLRMGLPRWLTAATISLGVVFIIWLCLVIPNNAPKQRVRKAKVRLKRGPRRSSR